MSIKRSGPMGSFFKHEYNDLKVSLTRPYLFDECGIEVWFIWKRGQSYLIASLRIASFVPSDPFLLSAVLGLEASFRSYTFSPQQGA